MHVGALLGGRRKHQKVSAGQGETALTYSSTRVDEVSAKVPREGAVGEGFTFAGFGSWETVVGEFVVVPEDEVRSMVVIENPETRPHQVPSDRARAFAKNLCGKSWGIGRLAGMARSRLSSATASDVALLHPWPVQGETINAICDQRG